MLERSESDGRYAHAVSALDGAIRPVPGCDGLSIDVSSLWAQIDALLTRSASEAHAGPP
jgi:hypothetical protein